MSRSDFPTAGTVISTVTLNRRNRATMHTPRIQKLKTQQEVLDGMTERLAAGKAADAEAKKTPKRARKQTWEFDNAAMNRFENSVFDLNFEHWSMDNPPRILTFVVRGSAFLSTKKKGSKEVFFQEVAPDLGELIKIVRDRFGARFKSAFGFELDAVFALEFQIHGNPHFHVLLTVPKNADGTDMLSNHPKGGRGNFAARFNGYNFGQWSELTLGDLTGQEADINRPSGRGRLTHLLEAHEVKPAASMEDYVGRYVNYIRKEGKDLKHKAIQHVTPSCYAGQHFAWWGVIGFANKRRVEGEKVRLECRTVAADLAVRTFFAARSRRGRTDFELPNGTKVDISMWSTELNRSMLTGGTFERPLTDEEVRQLRRLIMAMNTIPDEVPSYDEDFAAEPVVGKPMTPWQLAYGAKKMGPAFWETDDFDLDAFLAAQDERYVAPPAVVEEELVYDIRELLSDDDAFLGFLADSGFTAKERTKAAKTAVSQSSKKFIFTDAD